MLKDGSPVDQIKVLTPIGMLGYGIPAEWFWRGVAERPDVITVDAGSTDSGPQKLGLGSMTCSRDAYRKDIGLLLEAAHTHRIPVHITSAGGDGSNAHVDVFLDIVAEIAAARGYRFRAGAIYADMDKDHVKAALAAGRITPCGPVPALAPADVDAATTIVAQMGAEPFLELLGSHDDLDIVISGRTYDPVPIATAGLRQGFDPGLCWHMGKIMECGAQCAEPGGSNILGILSRDFFELEPTNPAERCTVSSVAAHTLYEKSHPSLLPGPGGTLDLSECRYEQVTERRVRVLRQPVHPLQSLYGEAGRRAALRAIAPSSSAPRATRSSSLRWRMRCCAWSSTCGSSSPMSRRSGTS